ncbi:hypothetical protein BU14_0746s0008 [Porphyra umbilicalis]|uniref:Uncharacterized protein n=1 Tax=Porphyra umbilicalis TaxID=2786 RepID=A0A1X6NPC1_PORUM|nr:hypothetical protein BU14_0746s0008 [Porphyra umbilicalis]|eukprot:OSX70468.1 hypothetical protein BU14_0746s0008 [Porphyra umbilicalis]
MATAGGSGRQQGRAAGGVRQDAGRVRAGGGEEGGWASGGEPPAAPSLAAPGRGDGGELKPPRRTHAACPGSPASVSAAALGSSSAETSAEMKRLAGASTLRGRVTNLRAVEDGVGGRLTTLVATLAGTAGRQHRQKYRCGAPRPPPRPFAAGRLRERGAVAGGGDGPGCGGHPVKQPDARGRPKCGGEGARATATARHGRGPPCALFSPLGGTGAPVKRPFRGHAVLWGAQPPGA